MSHDQLLIALENIIMDKISQHSQRKKLDTSALMEIGMAAKDDGENSREERGN